MENTTPQWEKAYVGLNPEQRKVAEKIYGPIIVIAGPGTGKTQTLATRIGYLLTEGPTVNPGEILALTFTEAGVVSMRKRIIDFIGVEGHRVNISTFHGFCNEIIQARPDYFGVNEFFPVSEIEQIEILAQIIDELPLDHILKRVKGDTYYEASRLKNLFKIMKEENWWEDVIEENVREYLESLPTNEAFIYKRANSKTGVKAGDVNQGKINEITERMEKLVAASKLMVRYNQLMESRKRYDFSDMIHWVIRALYKHPNFLRNYQERYQYFMVDEFQDTNAAQILLLNLLLSAWNEPNIMVIGDDDQSVYEFNGARIRNIQEFISNYNPEQIVLGTNYRSSEAIISPATQLIRNNHIRLSDKNLTAKVVSNIPAMVIEVGTMEEEEAFVLMAILREMKNGIPAEEIAVLYRKHRQADNLLKVLRRHDIPCYVKRRENVLKNKTVNWLILFLKMASNYSSNNTQNYFAYAGRIALLPFWDMNLMNVFKQKDLVSVEEEKFITITNQIIKSLNTNPVLVCIEEIFSVTGLYEWAIKNDPYGENVIALRTFWDFVLSESNKKHDYNYLDLLSTLSRMEDGDIPLNENVYEYAQKGVTFTTCHGAKGLEWNTVFIIGATKNEWESNRGGSATYSMPPTLVPSVEEDTEESNRRLFYVAMTRAKTQLIITYAKANNEGKELVRSMFVDQTGLVPFEYTVQPEMLQKYMVNTMAETEIVGQKHKLDEFFEDFAVKYVMSPSHLHDYQECGRKFYYERILKVPALANEAMSYGNAIHQALEKLILKWKSEKKISYDIDSFFMAAMKQNSHGFTEQKYQERLEIGLRHLNKYVELMASTVNVEHILNAEYHIKRVMIDGRIPMKGVIDRLDAGVIIRDYKTGRKKGFLEEVKKGGKYWKTGVIYADMINSMQFMDWRTQEVVFDLIDDEVMSVPIEFTKEDIIDIRKELWDVYQRIINLEFDHRCGECWWCKNSL